MKEKQEQVQEKKKPTLVEKLTEKRNHYDRVYLKAKADVYSVVIKNLENFDKNQTIDFLNIRAIEYQELQDFARMDAVDEIFRIMKRHRD